jgi:hypothetical protein
MKRFWMMIFPTLASRQTSRWLSSDPQILRSSGPQTLKPTWECSVRFAVLTMSSNFYKLLYFNQRLISHRIDFDHAFFDSLRKHQKLIRNWSIVKTITLAISLSKWLHSSHSSVLKYQLTEEDHWEIICSFLVDTKQNDRICLQKR